MRVSGTAKAVRAHGSASNLECSEVVLFAVDATMTDVVALGILLIHATLRSDW